MYNEEYTCEKVIISAVVANTRKQNRVVKFKEKLK